MRRGIQKPEATPASATAGAMGRQQRPPDPQPLCTIPASAVTAFTPINITITCRSGGTRARYTAANS